MAENPMMSDPDINKVEKALKNLDFLVVQDIFMNETAKLADVVLPGSSFAEKDGTFTNTERRVQLVKKAIDSPGEARQDWEILQDIAKGLGLESSYSHSSEIMEEAASLTPQYAGIRHNRLEGLGIQWPCTSLDHEGTQVLHKDKFTRGPGKFHSVNNIEPDEKPDSEYPFVLTTGRILEHYHTGTMTRRSKGIDEISPSGFVEISKADAKKLGILESELVKVASRRGEVKAKAYVTDKVPEGIIFMPFHFWESPANALTNPAIDPRAKIPEFKVCAVRISPAGK
jgi:predicted molibdopterin-dependent oxidoreductase YjgC